MIRKITRAIIIRSTGQNLFNEHENFSLSTQHVSSWVAAQNPLPMHPLHSYNQHISHSTLDISRSSVQSDDGGWMCEFNVLFLLKFCLAFKVFFKPTRENPSTVGRKHLPALMDKYFIYIPQENWHDYCSSSPYNTEYLRVCTRIFIFNNYSRLRHVARTVIY